MSDECSICLNGLTAGTPVLTLSCDHKYHLQCLALSLQAKNLECPLCRVPVDETVVNLLANTNNNLRQTREQVRDQNNQLHEENIPSSVSVILLRYLREKVFLEMYKIGNEFN